MKEPPRRPGLTAVPTMGRAGRPLRGLAGSLRKLITLASCPHALQCHGIQGQGTAPEKEQGGLRQEPGAHVCSA